MVWITVGFRHHPREKIFSAVIDEVEVKQVKDLSPRDIEHDNPEFRRLEETVKLPGEDLRPADLEGGHGHGDPLLSDRRAAEGPMGGNGEPPSPN